MSKILMVCLGNICRSPLAEGILRKQAEQRSLTITVDSCGTSGWHTGEPPDSRSQRNALDNGVDISMLRARQFKVSDFDEFDLIYTMDSSNHTDVVGLARNQDDMRKVAMILNSSSPGSDRPVPDPYYGGPGGFQHVFDLLQEACNAVLDQLEGQR